MYYTTALLFTHRVSADRDADQDCARSCVCAIAGRLEVCVRIGRCALWHCGIEARSEGTGEKGSLQLGPRRRKEWQVFPLAGRGWEAIGAGRGLVDRSSGREEAGMPDGCCVQRTRCRREEGGLVRVWAHMVRARDGFARRHVSSNLSETVRQDDRSPGGPWRGTLRLWRAWGVGNGRDGEDYGGCSVATGGGMGSREGAWRGLRIRACDCLAAAAGSMLCVRGLQ